MQFNEYQVEAIKTAIYKEKIIYPALGLCGEAGEVAEKIKKMLRDNNGILTEEIKENIKKELSDCLWYLANMSNDIGISLEEVAICNLEKINSRKERNKINGSGDNR